MVDIFQSVYGLLHFTTSVVEKSVSSSICSQGQPLLSFLFLQPLEPSVKIREGWLFFTALSPTFFPRCGSEKERIYSHLATLEFGRAVSPWRYLSLFRIIVQVEGNSEALNSKKTKFQIYVQGSPACIRSAKK